MDITQFNKELGKKIAIAQRFEKKGDIGAAIQEWVDISQMALNFSKSPKISASFKNMIINRTRGIFAHIKNLKASQFKEEKSSIDLITSEEVTIDKIPPQISQKEKFASQEKKLHKPQVNNSTNNNLPNIIEDSDLKNLPKGFKEIETTKDFNIITPHDKDFVKKQHVKANEIDMIKFKKQGILDEVSQPTNTSDFEEPQSGKNLICFACGYDKNSLNDKKCNNCGTDLN